MTNEDTSRLMSFDCEDEDEYQPSQWELYHCELTGPELNWFDRANSNFNIQEFLKRRYAKIDLIQNLSMRVSPLLSFLEAKAIKDNEAESFCLRGARGLAVKEYKGVWSNDR